MNERFRQILVIIATFGVIFVNFLAAFGYVNNKTTGELSDKYFTQITPAGYAFSIWSLIYLGLIVFSIYQALPANEDNRFFKRIRTIYIINCVANCAWIYAWHYEFIPLSLLIMFILLGTLAFINVVLIRADSTAEIITTKVPFNIYFGWITVATILNFAITLVYFGIRFPENITSIVGAILILIATALGCFLRFKISSAFYPLTIAWGITAIAVKQSGDTIVVVASAIGVILLLISALAGFIKNE
ncbi:MAG: TspO/MBR family protein [Aridibacter sp.]